MAAKNYNDNDTVKFKQSGDPFFTDGLEEQVYGPITGELTEAFKKNRDDAFARNVATRPILQRADNETVQAEAKGKFLRDQLSGYHGDKNLYDEGFAGTHLSAALRYGERRKLPSEFDAEAWADTVKADHNLYKEPEVIRRATEKLFPIISQKIAEAGQLGGQHMTDQVRGRFVAFDGKGQPVLNADGSSKLNLTADTDALLDSDPLFKMKTDARVKAYDAKREESIKAHEADPAVPVLPVMSRRGHHAQMVGSLAFYDQTHDEGLNAQVPRPRVAKDNPNKVQVRDFAAARQSDYLNPATNTQQTNHYAEVGQTFGSAAKPFVEVSAPTANMTIIGQDGKVTTTNPIKDGGNTKVKAQARVYSLYTKTGKRLGRAEPFATDQAAADYALKLARENTFNDGLPGTVGAFASLIGKVGDIPAIGLPVLRVVAPFTRIAASVLDRHLDYTAWGLVRAGRGGHGPKGFGGGYAFRDALRAAMIQPSEMPGLPPATRAAILAAGPEANHTLRTMPIAAAKKAVAAMRKAAVAAVAAGKQAVLDSHQPKPATK